MREKCFKNRLIWLVPLISKGTVFCAAELHFQGVQQADPEPEKQKERHIREGGEKRSISHWAKGKKNLSPPEFFPYFRERERMRKRAFFTTLHVHSILHMSLNSCFRSDVNCTLVWAGGI
ncbi:hypothetical protein EYD10_08703 [Varanus komodoensis]|nr:hypothetical protein EYD10_08703 [Varanus komodoensis]